MELVVRAVVEAEVLAEAVLVHSTNHRHLTTTQPARHMALLVDHTEHLVETHGRQDSGLEQLERRPEPGLDMLLADGELVDGRTEAILITEVKADRALPRHLRLRHRLKDAMRAPVSVLPAGDRTVWQRLSVGKTYLYFNFILMQKGHAITIDPLLFLLPVLEYLLVSAVKLESIEC